MSLLKIWVYHSFCIADIPTKSLISFFGGRSLSTSTLRRRNKNGLSTYKKWDARAKLTSRGNDPKMDVIPDAASLQLPVDLVRWFLRLPLIDRTSYQNPRKNRKHRVARNWEVPRVHEGCSVMRDTCLDKYCFFCVCGWGRGLNKRTCKGVPVKSRRNWLEYNLTTWERIDFSFLIRCASSMIRYRQLNFFRALFSAIAIS